MRGWHQNLKSSLLGPSKRFGPNLKKLPKGIAEILRSYEWVRWMYSQKTWEHHSSSYCHENRNITLFTQREVNLREAVLFAIRVKMNFSLTRRKTTMVTVRCRFPPEPTELSLLSSSQYWLILSFWTSAWIKMLLFRCIATMYSTVAPCANLLTLCYYWLRIWGSCCIF